MAAEDVTDVTVDAVVDDVVKRLLEAPPEVRWRALRVLVGHRAWVQALTVRQMLPAGRRQGVADLARRLGVTKGRISQLAAKAPEAGPALAWGRALAVAGQLATLGETRTPAGRLAAEHARLVEAGVRDGVAVRGDLEEASRRWAAAARRQRHAEEADRLLARLDDLLAQSEGAPVAPDLHDRAEILLGLQQNLAAH